MHVLLKIILFVSVLLNAWLGYVFLRVFVHECQMKAEIADEKKRRNMEGMDIKYFDGLHTILEDSNEKAGAAFAFQVHSNSNNMAVVGGDASFFERGCHKGQRHVELAKYREYVLVAMKDFFASWEYDETGKCCNVLIQSNDTSPLAYDKEGEGKFQSRAHMDMLDAESFFSFPGGDDNGK